MTPSKAEIMDAVRQVVRSEVDQFAKVPLVMSVKQICETYGVSENCFRKHAAAHGLTGFMAGRKMLYDGAQVHKFMMSGKCSDIGGAS